MLASCEESTALSRALSHLTETEENVALLWEKQAEADTVVYVFALFPWKKVMQIVLFQVRGGGSRIRGINWLAAGCF